jgi:BirA family biotin operon repressor/biotin-[acetyl-CoA-carboxylase] ligase
VKGQPATGYFLEKVPDILTPNMLKQRLRGGLFGKRVYHFFKTDSTNRVAMELGHAGEPEGAVVLAEEQTAGRGRAGHAWLSERATGIYVTLLLRPKIAPVQAPVLTMMAGLSAHAAVEAVTGLVVDLKWPNDLALESGKLGGILVESKTIRERLLFAVIGIGLNVGQRKAQLPIGATSLLLATGVQFDRHRLLKAIVDQIMSRYDDIDEPSSVIEEWWHNCIHRPPKVQVTAQEGTVTGITRGIDETGALTLETEDRRIRKVNEGTLRAIEESTS